jgi:hypothetical protein
MIDAYPVHLAAAGDLIFADDRDVVLRHARHRAGPASGARREIDRHAPLVADVLVLGVQAERLRRLLAQLRDDRGLAQVVLESCDADRIASFHQVMFLRRRQQIPPTGFRDLEPGAEPRCVGRAQEVRVERLGTGGRVSDATGHRPPVSEEDGHRLARMARHAKDRHVRDVPAVTKFDDVAVAQALLVGEQRVHPCRRIPRDLR